MFFTRLAYVVAVIALLLGAFNLGTVAAIEFGVITPREEAIKRYIGSSIGRSNDRGVYALLASIAFGALAEIGSALRQR
jgi:hypothetical protein